MAASVTRTAKRCGYCGRADEPLTREHVWPHWLGRHLGDQVEPHVRAEEDQLLRVWSRKLASQTVKRVCGSCNHGWMNDLEAAARPTLEALLQDRPLTLGREAQATLARWAVKTATACDLINPQPAAPQALRSLLVGGADPPEGVVVLMARYGGQRHPLLSGGWTRQVKVRIAGRESWVHMMQLTVTAGPVVFAVLGHGLRGVVELRPAGWKAEYAAVIWPPDRPVTWPPSKSLGDDELRRFAREI